MKTDFVSRHEVLATLCNDCLWFDVENGKPCSGKCSTWCAIMNLPTVDVKDEKSDTQEYLNRWGVAP